MVGWQKTHMHIAVGDQHTPQKKTCGSCALTHKRYCKHCSKHRFCYMAKAGTTEHLNMLFFGKKICIWRYVSPYYLLDFTTFAVDHDPNASLSCAFTCKPLNCRLNCNKCYSKMLFNIRMLFNILKTHLWVDNKMLFSKFTLQQLFLNVLRSFCASVASFSHE